MKCLGMAALHSELHDTVYPYCVNVCDKMMAFYDGHSDEINRNKVAAILSNNESCYFGGGYSRTHECKWIYENSYAPLAYRFFNEPFWPMRLAHPTLEWSQAYVHGCTESNALLVMEEPIAVEVDWENVMSRMTAPSWKYSHILNVAECERLHILRKVGSTFIMMAYDHSALMAVSCANQALDIRNQLMHVVEEEDDEEDDE